MRALALALVLPLAACAGSLAPPSAGTMPVDDTFRTSGQSSNDGTRIVHFHKLTEAAGGPALCIASAFEIGDGFFADDLERELMGKSWVSVGDRTVLATLLHNVPVTRARQIARPEAARCFPLGPGATAAAAEVHMPPALYLGEGRRKIHFLFRPLPEGTAADW